MDRAEAEINPFFLQIIPYIILLSEDKIFLYRRGEIGSEDRLHGKYSIGVGGHINPEDDPDGQPFYAFVNGAARELREEVGVNVSIDTLEGSAIGLLHDDSNDVGRVHLGVVLTIKVGAAMAADMLKTCENTMLEAQWIPLYELENPQLATQFETWSGFVAKHLISEACADAKWACPAFRERVTMLSISAANLSSSASSFLMQETPRGHMISKAMVETGAGEVQCMLAGLIGNGDIEGHEVKKAAKEFHATLSQIVKHQKFTEKDVTLKSE
jgi:predicted NUDIX family phosphoesterase